MQRLFSSPRSRVLWAVAPLFLLVMVFQRQIVSGLTAGAVKG